MSAAAKFQPSAAICRSPQYDTTSILRFITKRFALLTLPGLKLRDDALLANGHPPMGDLTNALSFWAPPVGRLGRKAFRTVRRRQSARGPVADRHAKLVILLALEGSCFGAYSKPAMLVHVRPRRRKSRKRGRRRITARSKGICPNGPSKVATNAFRRLSMSLSMPQIS